MKFIKFCVKCFLALFLVVLIIWTAALGLLQTQWGQAKAMNFAKGIIEKESGISIEIGNISFSFPLNLDFKDILLSQKGAGTIATIGRLEVCCAYTNLLHGRLVFSKLNASDIFIIRLPLPSGASSMADIPPLPFYVKFSQIDLQNIKLGKEILLQIPLREDLTGPLESSPFSIQGMISSNPFRQSMIAHLHVKTESVTPPMFPMNLSIDMQNNLLSLSLHLSDVPLHLIDPSVPQTFTGDLALTGSAIPNEWMTLLQKRHSNATIDGRFKMTLHAAQSTNSLLTDAAGSKTSLKGSYKLTSAQEIELTEITLKNDNLTLGGDAAFFMQKGIVKANLKGEWKRLDLFEPYLGRQIAGKVGISLETESSLSSPFLSMTLSSSKVTFSEQDFKEVQATVRTSLKPKSTGDAWIDLAFENDDSPWKISSAIEWKGADTLSISELEIAGLDTKATGHLAIAAPANRWNGELQAESHDLAKIAQVFGYSLEGSGKLALHFKEITDADGEMRQAIEGTVQGNSMHGPEWETGYAEAAFSFDPFTSNSPHLSLQTTIHGRDVKWNDYAAAAITLSSKQEIDIPSKKARKIAGNWNAQQLASNDGTVQEAEGELSILNPFDQPEGSITCSLKELDAHGVAVEYLSCSTSILQDGHWPFRIHGAGTGLEKFSFSSEGSWFVEPDRLFIQAERLNGYLGNNHINILQPVRFEKKGDAQNLSQLILAFGEGEFHLDFDLKGDQISAVFSTNSIPTNLLRQISPNIPLKGQAAFQGTLAGTLDNPKGRLKADLYAIQIDDGFLVQKPNLDGHVDLMLTDQGLQIESLLTGIGATPIAITGSLPFLFSLNPISYKLQPDFPIDLRLSAHGELDPYLGLFLQDAANISGQASIALAIKGQLKSPLVTGRFDITNGSYESASTGALYHDIEAHLEGEGTRLVLTSFSAQDSKNGLVSGSGTVFLDQDQGFPFEIEIRSSHLNILDSDFATLSSSGTLALKGNTQSSKLQGELTIDSGAIRLEEALPKQIKTVDVKYINLSKGEDPARFGENHDSAESTLELDVKLLTQENISIEGNHLKSQWKGSVAVTGSPEKPQLNGDLRLVEGEYDFNGNIFNLTQGSIHFAGSPDKKTTLYVVASKDLDRIKADIIVKGLTSKPEISFRSNPPLSQREVLSYILFNRGISDITPDQGEQLSQSFISLNSGEQTEGGADFLSRLRKNMGIDRLDFTSNDQDNNDFGLQVGKKITENLTVSVKQSMTSLSPIIAVEAKLRQNIKAAAEAGVVEDAPVRMSIKWKKDY